MTQVRLKGTLAKLKKVQIRLNFKKHVQPTSASPSPRPVPRGFKIAEKYPLYEPFAHVAIAQNPKTGEYKYILDELQLDPLERSVYQRILEILLAEIESPKEEIADPRKFFADEAKKIVDKYRISLGWLPDVSWYKILYHAERDLVGFSSIDPLMRDPNIEDISCDGVQRSVYIWHRNYESIETNIQFENDEELDNMVVKLVHMAGKHVSSAFPIVDASLPGKHRLAVCYRREVTPFGTAFTIRKFREDTVFNNRLDKHRHFLRGNGRLFLAVPRKQIVNHGPRRNSCRKNNSPKRLSLLDQAGKQNNHHRRNSRTKLAS